MNNLTATMIWSVVGMADDGSDKKKKKKSKRKGESCQPGHNKPKDSVAEYIFYF